MTEGKAGDFAPPLPDWYSAKAIADWLGISVLTLDDVPDFWLDRAAVALDAEAEVAREMKRRAQSA